MNNLINSLLSGFWLINLNIFKLDVFDCEKYEITLAILNHTQVEDQQAKYTAGYVFLSYSPTT